MSYKGNLSQVRIVVFTLLVLFFTYSVQAQESAHSAGGDGSSSIGSVAFSIGQVVYMTHSTVSGSEAQGVQQRFDLGAVSNLKAVVDNQTIEVSWEKPTENVLEIEGYNLEISEDSLNYVLVSKTTELSYKIENLTNSQKYWIRVSAYTAFSSGEAKVIGPLIPTAPAIEDVILAGTQEFGETVVVVNGVEVEPTIQTNENSVSLKVGDIVMDLGGSSKSGAKLPLVDGVLLLEPKGTIGLKGGGFKRNTSIVVWLIQNSAATTGGRLGNFNPYLQSRLIEEDNKYQYSSKVMGAKAGKAYFLGYSDVDAKGKFASDLEIPEDPYSRSEPYSGGFTLQARGIGEDGNPISINLGAIVIEDLTLDTDGDQVPDYLESREGTNPKDSASFLDTDKDGVTDGHEVRDNTNPNNPCSLLRESQTVIGNVLTWNQSDCDNDGVLNGQELLADTDKDGTPDFLDADDDGDGIPTSKEMPDPDKDGYVFDAVDADGDLIPDYLEPNAAKIDDEIEVYNAVTANGDGINDVLVIRNIGLYPDNELTITNRWGDQVYQTRNYGSKGNFFQGRHQKNYQELPAGIYFYVLQYRNQAGVNQQKQGYLYLTR